MTSEVGFRGAEPEAASLPDPCPPKTRADLEWDRLLAALADRCASESGRARAEALPFLSTPGAITLALAEVTEAFALAVRGEPLPRAPLADAEPALDRARLGALLSADEIRDIGNGLAQARVLRRFLRARGAEAPALLAACDSDPTLDALADDLARSFDADGSVSDQASDVLRDLREEQRAARARIQRRLEELVSRHRDLLSDGFWTERDGRHVLPVRADAHERFPGIVHDTSAGGMTLFVEPRLIVPLGNRQKVLDARVAREEEAVLAALSARIAERVDPIAHALDAIAHADLRAACAQLTEELDLHPPEVTDPLVPSEVLVELRNARHPLLQLDGVTVIASDLAVSAGSALVVSGPNAGGKTVALKTLGMAALMVRAGLPIAAGPRSRVAPFDRVLTDVGDDQSLTRNLSTFSAHVRNLADILERSGRGTLVLLDELAGGTDPREGEALATSVLEALCARGAAIACTTHYEGLKTLALGDERFANASVGFDLEAMTPTFRVTMGVPGASSALSVARRFGIGAPVIARAQELLGADAATVSELVARLEAERASLEREREALKREQERLETEGERLAAELERATARDRSRLTKEGEALVEGVKRARDELRAAQNRIKQEGADARALKDAERQIAEVARQVAVGGALEPRKPDEVARAEVRAVAVGMKVFVPRLRTEAQVVEVLGGGQVRVAAGPLKLLTSIDELKQVKSAPPAKGGGGGGPVRKPVAFDAASDPDVPIQTSDNAVDLRGLRAHEAVAMAEQFLDRCIGRGLRVAFLIHGHGTGALRKEIREAVKISPYVERSRPGDQREGGDGVTVVWLR